MLGVYQLKKKMFLSGGKALAEGAIYAGCRYYYGTPKILNNECVCSINMKYQYDLRFLNYFLFF